MMIRLLQRYCPDGFDEDIIHLLITRSFLLYRPQKAINMLLAQRFEAALHTVTALVPALGPEDPLRLRILLAAIYFMFDQSVLQWLLRSIPGNIEPTHRRESVILEAICRRLPERDPVSMKMIVLKTSNLHLPGLHQNQDVSTRPNTPTILTMYDANLFFYWRKILLEIGTDLKEFIRREIDEGLLKEEGWDEDSLTALFEYQFTPTPPQGKTVMGFPSCERCGAAGSKSTSQLTVDLAWRRTLRSLRRKEQIIPTEPTVRDIVIDLREPRAEGSTDCISECTVKVTSGPTAPPDEGLSAPPPYRLVCSEGCSDGVCVAWMYEDMFSGVLEPELESHLRSDGGDEDSAAYPAQLDGSAVVTESQCPSRNIPGAYVD